IFIGCFYRVVLGIKFHEDVYFKNIFHDNVFFEDINFNNKQILSVNQFKKEVSFFEVSFNDGMEIEDDFLQEKNISFKSCQFKKIIAFREKNIKNITFGTCTFEQGVYFVSCVFSNANFYNCNFNNAACFYGSTFNMAPNFSQSVFKDSPNLVNIKAKFDFQNLNTTIENIYKPKDEAANDFRDSFRTFKSALIKDNNLLDASNFHKYELYCKEIELKNKKAITFKDIVDRYQLFFYRKLCDHHTDLLKAFHNLLIVIMLFSMFSFVLDKFKQPSHIENDIKYNIVKVDSNENYIFKEHNKTTYNLLSLNIEQESDKFTKNDFVYMIVFLILVLLLLSFNIFTSIYIFGSILYLIFSFLDLLALYTHIAVIVFFVLFALKFILLDDRQRYKRGIVVAISYTVCIFTLLVKPSLLLPALGSFLDKDSNATYPLLLSLSVVYFMLVVLVLFSLQKTARKNSIVPS
ncbi:TPA: pentapeptide repeat-containing protein, partial [Campylobacter coli]|nr:pentapeptide repeat-containing protein [Campylobacter coli]